MKKLTPKQELFVAEYLVDLNATQAALRAGYSEATAAKIGSENLQKPEVAAAIAAAQAKRMERVGISHDEVLRILIDIATADPNELVEHRTGACRHCHGEGHRYQFTLNEFARLNEEREREIARATARNEPLGPLDPAGGLGFNPNRPPHPDCPECHGEGESRPIFKDTARASRGAKALYAGFKLTKDGMEMKLHPKMDALEKIAKHNGFYAPQKVEVDGTVGVTLDAGFADEIAAAVKAAKEAAARASE